MKYSNLKNQNGFVALISAVIVSAVLLVIASPMARTSFWARFEMLAQENKKISVEMAQGCIDLALLAITRNEIVTWDKCQIIENKKLENSDWEIIARANWKNSYTNLKVNAKILDNDEIKIISWNEF